MLIAAAGDAVSTQWLTLVSSEVSDMTQCLHGINASL